jgi:hypothetical protein
VAKSHSRRVAVAPARIKTAVRISPEAFRRLGAACIAENMTHSEVVEFLINRDLSGYVVSVRGERIRHSEDRHDLSGEINSDGAAAA